MKANHFESALSKTPIGKRKYMKKKKKRQERKNKLLQESNPAHCLREIFLTTTLRDEMDLTYCLTYRFSRIDGIVL